MRSPSMIFGGNTGRSYEDLQRQRQIINAMASRKIAPKSVGEGLSALGQALAYRLMRGRVAKADAAGRDQFNTSFNAWSGGLVAGSNEPASFNLASSDSKNAPRQTSMDLSGDKRAFIDALMPAAIEQSRRTGIDPRVIIGQAALETGWGRAAPGNNFFGIKSHGKEGGQTLTTHEVIDGKRVKIRDRFRQYESPADSVRGYGDFILHNPRYGNFRAAQGLDNQLAELQASGYATDPNYGAKVGQIARSIPLPQQQPEQGASPDPSAGVSMAFAPPDQQPEQQPPVPLMQGQSQQQPRSQHPNNAFGDVDPRLIQLMGNPYATPGQQAFMQMMLKRQLDANTPADPLTQLRMQREQLELQRMRNPQANPMDAIKLQQEQLRLEQMQNPERSIVEGADGFKYYQDTGERVLPHIVQPQAQPAPTDDMREYELAKSQGYEGSLQDWILGQRKAGAPRVNVSTGDNGPSVPAYNRLPAGYVYKRDPNGQIIIDENGVPIATPIAGGPAALEAEKRAAAEQAKQVSTARSGNVVLEDIDRALAGLESGMLPTAGPIGGALSMVPGTQAYDVGQLIETIKANSGFDRLQAMRDSSPTGGALGAINQSEMGLLQAALGNLSQSQSAEQLKFNLQRVRKIYQEIVHGPSQSDADASLDDLLKKYADQ